MPRPTQYKKRTKQIIAEACEQLSRQKGPFSSEDVRAKTGLNRVTVAKYLRQLLADRVLNFDEMEYNYLNEKI